MNDTIRGEEMTLDCEVEVVLRKKVKVSTDNTICIDGVWSVCEDEDLAERYKEQHLTLDSLLKKLSESMDKKIINSIQDADTRKNLLELVDACQGWEILSTKCE